MMIRNNPVHEFFFKFMDTDNSLVLTVTRGEGVGGEEGERGSQLYGDGMGIDSVRTQCNM